MLPVEFDGSVPIPPQHAGDKLLESGICGKLKNNNCCLEELQLSDSLSSNFERLKQRFEEMLQYCTEPQDRRIGYGNVRHEYSEWKRSSEVTTNLAIIYETPGGSTTQINVTYDHGADEFSYIDHNCEKQVVTNDPRQVLRMIEEHLREIPAKRLQQLHQQIDMWLGEGKSRSHVFGELNKLLQTEFLGGRVNTAELKQAIQYAVAQCSNPQ